MSFILTSQAADDTPYSYQNSFANTIEIKPNSKIALNHATINRNALFNFDSPKVVHVYHGAVLPVSWPYEPGDDPQAPAYVRDTFGFEYRSYDTNPKPGTPSTPVVIPTGDYSVEGLAAALEQQLNNPTAELGGDFMVSGGWTVNAVRSNTVGEFEHFEFLWSGTKSIDGTAEALATNEIVSLKNTVSNQGDITVSSQASGATITSSYPSGLSGFWQSGAIGQRFVAQAGGVYEFDLDDIVKTDQNGAVLFGLTRIAPDDTLSIVNFVEFEPSETGAGDSFPYNHIGAGLQDADDTNKQYWFFDYCVYVYLDDMGEWDLRLYQSIAEYDSQLEWDMREVALSASNYTKPTVDKTYRVRFKIDGEKVNVFTQHQDDMQEKDLAVDLKPIGSNCYQMVQKVCFDENGMSVGLTSAKYVSVEHKPVLRTVGGAGVAASASMVNTRWSAAIYNGDYRRHTGYPLNSYKYRWDFVTPDTDAAYFYKYNQVDLTDKTVDYVEELFGASLIRWEPDPENDKGVRYRYLTVPSGANSEVLYPSTALVGFDDKAGTYNAIGTLGMALGLHKPHHSMFNYLSDPNNTGKTLAQLIGSGNITLVANEDLYVRIDLGTTKSVNGVTGSLSRIVSPILTDISQSSGVSGVRHYIPQQRMYLDLNNVTSLFVNSIRVEFVTKTERYAVELSPTTSVSFHIM
eukprot:SAG22_NODE_509_length_9598_cov_12.010001_6_plen_687_part_00